MRDLTGDEINQAPEWATHYQLDDDDNVIYKEDRFGGYEGRKGVKILPKPFDITNHEFSDSFTYFDFELHSDDGVVIIDGSIDKQDVIAIAKFLGVTGEDLK